MPRQAKDKGLPLSENGGSRLRPLVLEPGRTAQEQAYAALRRGLMAGDLRPGEEVSLRHVAAALGTSVTPVREALRQLEREGGLEIHGGNRVCRVPVLDPEDLDQIREIRVQLEGMATQAAASRISAAQRRLVTNACRLMQRAVEAGDHDLYLENNWRFHSLIYGAAGRQILLGMIEGLWLRTGPLVRLALARPGHLDTSMQCHWAAERALREGDAVAAREAILRDITEATGDLTDILETPKQNRRSRE